MQAMAQTNPANSRAIAVTTTCSTCLSRSCDDIAAPPELRFPSNRAHRFRHNLYGRQLVTGDAGRKAVTMGGLDEQGAGVNVASFGNGAHAALRAGGVFRGH